MCPTPMMCLLSLIYDVFSMTDVLEVADVIDVTSIPNVTDIHEVSNVNNATYDSSTTSDILQVTITGEGLKFHCYVDIEYDASDSLLLSTMSDDDSKNGMVNQKDIPIPKTRIVWDPGTFYVLLLHQNLQETPHT
jgi:copper(I)-binding protein